MSEVTMKPCTSSAFIAEGFDAENSELRVTWQGGNTYAYPCIKEKYAEFQAAESKGKFFLANFDRKAGRKIVAEAAVLQ